MRLLSGVPCVNGTLMDAMLLLCYLSMFIFCRPAQRGVQDWKARISIRSFNASESDGSAPPPSHVHSAVSPPILPQNPPQSLTPHLCYACHTTLTSRSSRGTALQAKTVSHNNNKMVVAPLPVWVNSRLLESTINPGNTHRDELGESSAEEVWQGKPMDVDEMRDAVKDFLLGD
jgi:cytoplasmic tRNA 2-thiolation protein 2